VASRAVSVLTWHNGNYRNGANYEETTLTVDNVNTSTFGKLYSLPVDGQVYAQPLYLSDVNIAGSGTYNVLYVATENNSVYAFNADSSSQQPLWQVNLGTPVPYANAPGGVYPLIGILSTPVIDTNRQVIYVVSETLTVSGSLFSLHALNLANGEEMFGGPAVISGQVAGTGEGSSNGVLVFDPIQNLQRPGLLELNGNIYIGFGSHGDKEPYHGWLFAYDGASLQQLAFTCLSPNGYGGAVWQSGAGIAADVSGNVYVATGNGDFNPAIGDFGDSVLKLNPTSLAITSYFSPNLELYFQENDLDVSAGGVSLIPSPTSSSAPPMVVTGSKAGDYYVMNSADLGGYNAPDDVAQEWTSPPYHYGGTVYYDNYLFAWDSNDVLRTYLYNGTYFQNIWLGSYKPFNSIKNSPAMSLSANAYTGGSAILWAVHSQSQTDGANYPGLLHAYNAATGVEIWNSNMRGPLDYSGSWAKFCPPTIANGKVYLATFDGIVNVFGLLSQ
jgi:hypothetical protein